MTYSPRCANFVEVWESLQLAAYQDPGGVWTIGWGHTKGVRQGDKCTPSQAGAWLRDDMDDAATGVRSAIHVALTQWQFDALTSFQMNTGGLTRPVCTLRSLLNAGQMAAVAEQFVRWDHDATGHVLAGLLRRRNEERIMFLGLEK